MIFSELRKLDKKMRLMHYKSLFGRIKEKAGSLSATEAYSADVINLLEKPTIKEFADCLGISQPNATYKVASLIEKGYITKEISSADRREWKLSMSEKFFGYFDTEDKSIKSAVEKLKREFTEEELNVFGRMLKALNTAI